MTKAAKKREYRVCEHCNKTIYGNIYSFKSHLFVHNAVKPNYVCDVCLKPYFRRDTFSRHMTNHLENGETNSIEFRYKVKGFTCNYCERRFKDKRNLINHLKVHDDGYYSISRRYKCPACHIAYCEERLLKNHIRREHFNLEQKDNIFQLKKLNETWLEPIQNSKACVQITKVKPNMMSIKKTNVKLEAAGDVPKIKINFEHMTHYSKVICDYCKKEMLKKSLITHIKERHLKIRKFSCKICKRTFKRHYQMVDHDCKRRTRRKYEEA